MLRSDRKTKCPHCRKPIRDSSNLAVCVECGMAHHLECWRDMDGCADPDCRKRLFRLEPSFDDDLDDYPDDYGDYYDEDEYDEDDDFYDEDDEEYYDDDEERGVFPFILKVVLLMILFGGIVGGAIFYLTNYVFLPEVTVPDVRNLDRAGAVRAIIEAGLVPNEEVFYVYDEQVAVGSAVKTEPPGGRVVRKNRVVDIYMSKGPEYIVTPDLTGRTEMEARVILQDLGLGMKTSQVFNENVPAGQIFRQVPGESFHVMPGEEVEVFISRGRGPFKIDNLVGYSRDGALAYLEENGLRPRVRYRFSVEFSGHVIEQVPAAGEQVEPGQTVDLVVGE